MLPAFSRLFIPDCSCWIVHSWVFRWFSLMFIYFNMEIRSTRVILTLPYFLSLMLLVCISLVPCCLYIRTINRFLVCIFESSICFLLSVYPDHQCHSCLYIRITHLFLVVSISGSSFCSLFQYQDRQLCSLLFVYPDLQFVPFCLYIKIVILCSLLFAYLHRRYLSCLLIPINDAFFRISLICSQMSTNSGMFSTVACTVQ